MRPVRIKNFIVGPDQPLTVISGPCVIESEQLAFETAGLLKELALSLGIQFVYKSSYDKANRSSYHSFRGPGIEAGLEILAKVKKEFDIPVLTDIHSPEEAAIAAEVCDVIQIPAFLCRQTDLIIAAGQTGAVVNVKKGQFMAPADMENIVQKLLSTGNENIILTDRGTTFGYNNLVTDVRAIPIMQAFGFPVCFDASHSAMLPGGNGQSSGGQRQFIPTLARAAVAAGANCLFVESHSNPSQAKSDRDTVMDIRHLRPMLEDVQQIYDLMQRMKKPCSVD